MLCEEAPVPACLTFNSDFSVSPYIYYYYYCFIFLWDSSQNVCSNMLQNFKKAIIISFYALLCVHSPPVNNLNSHYTEKGLQSQEMFCFVVCFTVYQTYILMKQEGEAVHHFSVLTSLAIRLSPLFLPDCVTGHSLSSVLTPNEEHSFPHCLSRDAGV